MKILPLIALSLLASCADPFVWYRSGVPANEYRADVADCVSETDRFTTLVGGDTLYRLFNYCMAEEKGYTLTDPKTARPWNRKDVEKRLAEEQEKESALTDPETRKYVKKRLEEELKKIDDLAEELK